MTGKTADERREYARTYAKEKRKTDPVYAAKGRQQSCAAARGRMLKQHGITEDDFSLMLGQQNGVCAICSTPFTTISGGRSRSGKPHVDHDHATGKVRGLLCLQCNSLLGHARDNQSIIDSARLYLKSHGTNAPRRGWSGTVAGKAWGVTSALIVTSTIELHRIIVEPNAKCSLHMHRMKHNAFIVLSGVLMIDVHKNDYDLIDTTTMTEGDVVTVRPTEYHRFRTGSVGAEALEIYYPEPLSEDIVRKDVGGKATVLTAPEVDANYNAIGTIVDGGTIDGEDGSETIADKVADVRSRYLSIGPYGNNF